MYKHIYIVLVFVFILITKTSNAQNNTNSPYSIFALGAENIIATGALNGLGNSGIAQTNPLYINILNPASLGSIKQKSFLYEFGANATTSTLRNSSTSSNVNNANLSHIAIAFPIRKNWGIGLGLTPFTKVGYEISFDREVLGSSNNNESFTTFNSGLGGLNRFYLASGAKLGNVISVGLELSVLFGTVEERSQLLSDGLVNITNESTYNGFNFRGGFQYTFPNKKTTIGSTFAFNSLVTGTTISNSFVTTNAGNINTIQDNEESEADNLEFPITFGIGVTSEIYKDFTASLDFRKRLWDDISQSLDNEEYTNQDTYAFGLEYKSSANNTKYWNKLSYRFGANYNSGFLVISNRQIDSYFLSLGLGIPLNRTGTNNINFSYSYGQEGTIDNNLIQENFHQFTLNLSFVGNWFNQRKIF